MYSITEDIYISKYFLLLEKPHRPMGPGKIFISALIIIIIIITYHVK